MYFFFYLAEYSKEKMLIDIELEDDSDTFMSIHKIMKYLSIQ